MLLPPLVGLPLNLAELRCPRAANVLGMNADSSIADLDVKGANRSRMTFGH